MDPLIERLKALGLIQASQMKSVVKTPSNNKLEDILDGQEAANSLGSCYVTTSLYPWNYRHGKVIFEKAGDLSLIAEAGRAKGLREQDLSNLLFLDTETTGLAGGTGTLAFLIGLGFFTDDGFLLKQYIIRDPTEEPAMLLEVANMFEKFPSIVSFNGKAFDIPLLRARYVLNRLPVPFEDLSHLDLLFLSRKLWKNRLKSRALQDLEGEILDLPRTEDEVPGYMIPEIYFDYLRTGNAEPLKGVVYHNGMDIVSLAALFLHISSSFDQLSGEARMHPVDYFSIGQIFQDLEMVELAEKILLECISARSLPHEMNLEALKRVASIYKRRESYESAILYWGQAADLGDIDSSIELAKYFEHIGREYGTALQWSETAAATLAKRGYHNYQDRQLRKDIDKRIVRLKQKMEKGNKNVPTKDS
jgi:uncharacterized protein YprB with RNaseH-like and TPR domain